MTHILIQQLIDTLHNIQSQIDSAAGAATALDLRVRIIAQLSPTVQAELSKKTRQPFHQATLEPLINAVVEVFQDKLSAEDQEMIKSCRPPRNKVIHGSFAELMINLSGVAHGREIDPKTGKESF